jgi:hypothetical protein
MAIPPFSDEVNTRTVWSLVVCGPKFVCRAREPRFPSSRKLFVEPEWGQFIPGVNIKLRFIFGKYN